MTPKAGWYTPMLHVTDVERSITFYQSLGFELVATEGKDPPFWARLHCDGGAVMLLRAEEPVEREERSVLFYLYTPDLPALIDHLSAQHVRSSEVKYPEHAPAGEIHLRDPDGYFIGIMHWGEKEHTEWLERIGKGEP